jgi:RNA polymerase sigma factor FliA
LGDEAQEPKKGPQRVPPNRRPGLNRRPRPQATSPGGASPVENKADEPKKSKPPRSASSPKPEEAEAEAPEGTEDELEAEEASSDEPPADFNEVLPLEPPPLDQDVLSVPPPSKTMTRKELTEQYQPYVRSIAGKIKKTLSKDIEFDDLVSYGMLGLFEAADRYDSKFGANFMTFAYYRIRGAIYDGLRGMGWVSRTEYQRYRFEMQANQYLTSMNDQQVSAPSAVKKSTEDEIGEIADVVTGLVTIYVTALDAMEGFQIKDDRGPSVEESLEIMQARKLVADAVAKLPEQERTLLQLYYYKEMSLEDVGKQLGLSKSWTSRLHTRAIEKLSRLLRDLVSEYQEGGGGGGTGSPPPGSGAKGAQKSAQPTGPPTR